MSRRLSIDERLWRRMISDDNDDDAGRIIPYKYAKYFGMTYVPTKLTLINFRTELLYNFRINLSRTTQTQTDLTDDHAKILVTQTLAGIIK